jgi:hypothetical protein
MFEVWFAMDSAHSLVSLAAEAEEAEALAAKLNDAAFAGEFYYVECWDPSMDPACDLF